MSAPHSSSAPDERAANRSAPTALNTCAVFVTYHPDSDFCDHVRRVQQQLPHVIIVDNHSHSETVAMLQTFASQGDGTVLLANSDNRGIATALNQATGEARQRGYEWILTFDQDSQCEPFLWSALTAIYANDPAPHRIALIGSNYISSGTGRAVHRFPPGSPAAVTVPMCITSASLTSLHALAEVGSFEDALFIDSVDTELCLRFRAAHFRVLMSTRPLIRHSIGNQIVRHILGLSICTSDHSAQRRYYMARNRTLLARRFAFREFRCVWHDLLNLVEQVIVLVLFEADKWNKFKAYGRGISDGLRGRTGRRELTESTRRG
ncbi:MAG: glycosyltransferase [Lentisphaerae bacterium]|nr:glycosyltransferase [Lentisphaerota bacterium]